MQTIKFEKVFNPKAPSSSSELIIFWDGSSLKQLGFDGVIKELAPETKVAAKEQGIDITQIEEDFISYSMVIPSGAKGEKGETGPRGLPGKDGLNGINGETGPRGLPGKDGKDAYDVIITSDSDNVTITKRNNEYGIAVSIPEVTKEVIKEYIGGGGISKNSVEKMINAAISSIEISGGQADLSNYTLLSTTASISGDLQNQINQIVQEGTTIESSGGSIIVSQNGTAFNIEVASAPIQNHNDLNGLNTGDFIHLTSSEYANISGGNFVKKSGDTMTGQLTMSGAAIQLDTAHTPAWSEGKIFYDSQYHSLAYYNDNNEVTIQVGQEEVVRVRNNTGSTIANGKVVCINGSSGSHPLIILASNTSSTLSHSTLGVATHDINDNENGYITVSGLVNGLNTNSFSAAGVTLWLGTNGSLTETEPVAPNHKVKIGYLVRKHITQGQILVAIDTGSDLGDLHDVSIGDYEDGALLVANGSIWSPGANVNDLATKIEVASISGALDNRIDLLEAIKDDTNEPNGFLNRTDSTLTYTPSAASFSISGNYSIYLDGNKFSKTGDSVTLTPAYGPKYIYYTNGTAAFTVSPTLFDIAKDAPIAYVFFNNGATDSFHAEERHGITMDGVTHEYLHRTQGAKYVSGMVLGDYNLNTDTVADNKYSIAAGTFYDEDILNAVTALADNGPYNIFYRTGASGNWTWSKTEAYPYFINANSIRYNQFTGGAWQLTDITTNNRWVNYYVFATNALTPGFGYIIIPGQTIYSSLTIAQGESVSNLSLGNLPFAEIVPVARVTHAYASGHSTTNGRARIVAVASLTATSFASAIATASNHNSLSGLQGGVAGEYYHLTSAQYDDYIGASSVAALSGSLLSTTYAASANALAQANAQAVLLTTDQTISGTKTFNNDVIVSGNLTVNGSNFIVNTVSVSAKDNQIIINSGEVGAGVTAGVAGIRVDRGSLPKYDFQFRESDDSFVIGISGSYQAVATRQDTPLDTGIAVWNAAANRFDTSTNLSFNSDILALNSAYINLKGPIGNPAYVRVDQTANSGKLWRVGNTGAIGYSDFGIYNETDGVNALSILANGNATFAGAATFASSVSCTKLTASGGTISDAALGVDSTNGFNIGGVRSWAYGRTATDKDFSFITYDAGGSYQAQPLIIRHATGISTFAGSAPGTPGATEVLIGAGQIKCGAGVTCTMLTASGTVSAHSFETAFVSETTTNAAAALNINYIGYAGGITQFRNLDIYDGKAVLCATFVGSTKSLTVYGPVTCTTLTAAGSVSFGSDASYSNGSLYNNATHGSVFACQTGSSHDFYLGTPTSGQYIAQVPTGTRNVEFGGAATFASSVSATTFRSGATQVVGAQGAAVADATDAASAITQLNALLARCRAHGLIA